MGRLGFHNNHADFPDSVFSFYLFPKEPTKTNRFILYSRTWMDIFLALVGCPLTIKGREYFRKGETYIVVSNHNSLIDVPVSSPGIPGGNKTIAKAENGKNPTVRTDL
ncbi:MAG: 1-acyl-sn-glycerol-3-phosphate acyltransferase [Puia sp.]